MENFMIPASPILRGLEISTPFSFNEIKETQKNHVSEFQSRIIKKLVEHSGKNNIIRALFFSIIDRLIRYFLNRQKTVRPNGKVENNPRYEHYIRFKADASQEEMVNLTKERQITAKFNYKVNKFNAHIDDKKQSIEERNDIQNNLKVFLSSGVQTLQDKEKKKLENLLQMSKAQTLGSTLTLIQECLLTLEQEKPLIKETSPSLKSLQELIENCDDHELKKIYHELNDEMISLEAFKSELNNRIVAQEQVEEEFKASQWIFLKDHLATQIKNQIVAHLKESKKIIKDFIKIEKKQRENYQPASAIEQHILKRMPELIAPLKKLLKEMKIDENASLETLTLQANDIMNLFEETLLKIETEPFFKGNIIYCLDFSSKLHQLYNRRTEALLKILDLYPNSFDEFKEVIQQDAPAHRFERVNRFYTEFFNKENEENFEDIQLNEKKTDIEVLKEISETTHEQETSEQKQLKETSASLGGSLGRTIMNWLKPAESDKKVVSPVPIPKAEDNEWVSSFKKLSPQELNQRKEQITAELNKNIKNCNPDQLTKNDLQIRQAQINKLTQELLEIEKFIKEKK